MIEETFEDIANTLSAEQQTEENQEGTNLETVAESLKKEEVVVQEEKKEETLDVVDENKEGDDLIELELEEEKKEDNKSEPFNFESLSEIGIEAKTPTELKEVISSLKNERDTLKSLADEKYANEEIRKLNDFVKQGGDLKQYTNDVETINKYENIVKALDGISPQEAYKQSVVMGFGVQSISELPEEKQQQILDFIEMKNPIEVEIEGKKIINAEKSAYLAEVKKLQEGIEASKQNLEKKNAAYTSNVSKAIQALTGVDGIKVKDAEKQELAVLLKNPKQALAQLMPLDENGLPDAGALVEIVYRHKYGKRNTELLLKQAKSKGRKEVFSRIENSNGQDVTQHSKSEAKSDDVDKAIAGM